MTEVLKKRPEYEQLAQTIFIQLIRPDNKNLVVDAIKEHLTEGMMIIIFTISIIKLYSGNDFGVNLILPFRLQNPPTS